MDARTCPASTAAGNGQLVLIVEDNPTNARVAQDMLCAAGYATEVAVDGVEGLRMARELNPELILTDLQMPRMDGLSLTRHLKADPQTAFIPVVAVTAHAMHEHRNEAFQAGCCGFITKPFRYRELLNELNHAFQLHQSS